MNDVVYYKTMGHKDFWIGLALLLFVAVIIVIMLFIRDVSIPEPQLKSTEIKSRIDLKISPEPSDKKN